MITSKRFRHKTTGEIVTQVPLMDTCDYEEVETYNILGRRGTGETELLQQTESEELAKKMVADFDALFNEGEVTHWDVWYEKG